jgi:hypothetical protein
LLDSAQGKQFLQGPAVAILVWDAGARRLVGVAKGPDAAYLNLDASAPVWQLEDGWMGNQGTYRWMEPAAKARLYRPAGASKLEVVVNVSEYYIAHLHESQFEVMLNGASLGSRTLTVAKPVAIQFPVPAGEAGTAEVEFRVSPPLEDPNHGKPLGQPIAAFGFK